MFFIQRTFFKVVVAALALVVSLQVSASTDALNIDIHRGEVLTSNGKKDAGTTTDSPRFQIFTKRDGKNSRAEYRFKNDFNNQNTITFVGEMRVLNWSSVPEASNISVAQTLSDAAKPGDGASPLSQLTLNANLEFYELHAPRDGNDQFCLDGETGAPARIFEGGGYRAIKIVYHQLNRSSQMFVQTRKNGPMWPCPVVTSHTHTIQRRWSEFLRAIYQDWCLPSELGGRQRACTVAQFFSQWQAVGAVMAGTLL